LVPLVPVDAAQLVPVTDAQLLALSDAAQVAGGAGSVPPGSAAVAGG
jgi:hypothetical protein